MLWGGPQAPTEPSSAQTLGRQLMHSIIGMAFAERTGQI